MSIKSVIQNLAAGAVADRVIEHVASQARGPVIAENPPRVAGWKQHNTPGREPTWSCPPWSGQAERDYTSKMAAIAGTLRLQKMAHETAVLEHRAVGEPDEFVSQNLPGDLRSLPRSIAANARRLLRAEGWL